MPWACAACTFATNADYAGACKVCYSPRGAGGADDAGAPAQQADAAISKRHRGASPGPGAGAIDLTGDTDETDRQAREVEARRKRRREKARAAAAARDAALAARMQEEESQGARAEEDEPPAAAAAAPKHRPPILPVLEHLDHASQFAELLRHSSENTLQGGSCVNVDHATEFLKRHERELEASAQRTATVLVVYHGTKKENLRKIMDGNLKVPDGRQVVHTTDQGWYGKGVYTAPRMETAQAYAANGPMFVCLALPGRQYQACDSLSDQGQPLKAGYDSHFGGGGSELVFFHADQLLPVFIAEAQAIPKATELAKAAIDALAKATGNRYPLSD